MISTISNRQRLIPLCIMTGLMLLAGRAVASEDDWGFDLNLYGWLPIISIELEDGTKDEITRDDILKDFDSPRCGQFALARAHGR